MATLFERYNVAGQSESIAYDNFWMAQTITIGNTGANVNFNISYFTLKLKRTGLPGTINIDLKNVDGSGHPGTTTYSSGSINGDNLDETYTITQIDMSAYEIQASTEYAIVVSAPNGVFANRLNWKRQSSSPAYTGGNEERSSDDGTSWSAIATDFIFEVWGETISAGTNTQINIGDAWKEISAMQINIGDTWKAVVGAQVNIGDAWKTIF